MVCVSGRAVFEANWDQLSAGAETTVRDTTTEPTPVLGRPTLPVTWIAVQVFTGKGPVTPPVPSRVSTSRPCTGTKTPDWAGPGSVIGTDAGAAATALAGTAAAAAEEGAANAGALSPYTETAAATIIPIRILKARKTAETGWKKAGSRRLRTIVIPTRLSTKQTQGVSSTKARSH